MNMPRVPACCSLLLLLALAACGAPGGGDQGQPAPLECVPFARALSGINLRGDAAVWWDHAAGRYQRGQVPEVGAAMVFTATSRLPKGHVAVVSRVLSRREVYVTQANWVHHRVTTDQLVRDESIGGDWSLVRVWWPPTNSLGSTPYPVSGFIYSGYALSHEQVVGAVPNAIRLALRD